MSAICGHPASATAARSSARAPDLDAPDIQLHFGGGASVREATDPLIPHDGFTIFPTLLAPTSRSQVTLRSRLAHAKPQILHNYYATEDDTRSMIDGTRVALEIASRPALRKLRTADWAVPESDSDADILEFARHNTRTTSTPWGRARWAAWSIPSCASTASSTCASSMPR
jgi:choline dehydrogenase